MVALYFFFSFRLLPTDTHTQTRTHANGGCVYVFSPSFSRRVLCAFLFFFNQQQHISPCCVCLFLSLFWYRVQSEFCLHRRFDSVSIGVIASEICCTTLKHSEFCQTTVMTFVGMALFALSYIIDIEQCNKQQCNLIPGSCVSAVQHTPSHMHTQEWSKNFPPEISFVSFVSFD